MITKEWKRITIYTKARKHKGVSYLAQETKYSVDLNNGITIYENRVKKTSFKVGDTASYDSFNLVYLGTIEKITDKAVTIIAYKGYKNLVLKLRWFK